MKTCCCALAIFLGTVLGIAVVNCVLAADSHDGVSRESTSEGPAEEGLDGALDQPQLQQQRLREGSTLQDALGKFEVTGDRITFYPRDGLEPLRTLENLALERVARELAGIPREREWRVSGLITEYQGGNYLLVHRAIMKSNSAD